MEPQVPCRRPCCDSASFHGSVYSCGRASCGCCLGPKWRPGSATNHALLAHVSRTGDAICVCGRPGNGRRPRTWQLPPRARQRSCCPGCWSEFCRYGRCFAAGRRCNRDRVPATPAGRCGRRCGDPHSRDSGGVFGSAGLAARDILRCRERGRRNPGVECLERRCGYAFSCSDCRARTPLRRYSSKS